MHGTREPGSRAEGLAVCGRRGWGGVSGSRPGRLRGTGPVTVPGGVRVSKLGLAYSEAGEWSGGLNSFLRKFIST